MNEFTFDIELNGKSYNLSARERENNGAIEYIIGIPTYFKYVENGQLKSVPSEKMFRMVRKPSGEYSFVPWRKEMFGVGIYAIQQEVSNYLLEHKAA